MKKKYFYIFLSACLIINACKKSETLSSQTDILSYNIQGSHAQININAADHFINITFPDTVIQANDLIADFTLSTGCSVSINNIKQTSGTSTVNFDTAFSYAVTAPNGSIEQWSVVSSNNSYSSIWGLGNFITAIQNNNRDYSWYIDQLHTGFDSIDNCGPAASVMVCKWVDSTFTKTPANARSQYVPQGGWWSTNNIDSFLNDNNVTHGFISLPSTSSGTATALQKQIDEKQIVILCVDMNYIRSAQNSSYHVDKFYYTSPGDGHFLVVKGYLQIGNEIYFDVYDPGSMGQTYADGILMGEDRFYRYEDIFNATYNWWQFAIVIAQNGNTLITNSIENAKKEFIPVGYAK